MFSSALVSKTGRHCGRCAEAGRPFGNDVAGGACPVSPAGEEAADGFFGAPGDTRIEAGQPAVSWRPAGERRFWRLQPAPVSLAEHAARAW